MNKEIQKSDFSVPYFFSALSIDVEDGLNILMRDIFNTEMPPTTRVVSNVNRLLDLFEEKNVRATFFVLGEVAKEYPSLIKSISAKGHEIGVHGFNHDQIFKLTPSSARKDISRAKAILEDITGENIYGFRAPAFSICERTSWGLDVISDLGFTYDSSIVPARRARYGWPGFDKNIHRMILPGGNSLIEVPISVIGPKGREIPVCGGGYLRYLPYIFTEISFKILQKQRPVIVYMHPYEIDEEKYPDFFYEAMRTLNIRRRIPLSLYRLNKGTVFTKLERLIRDNKFKPIIDIVHDLEKSSQLASVNIKDLIESH